MPKKPNYFENVAKEINESYQAWRATGQASNEVGPGTDARANVLKRMEQKQFGQLVGAVVKGAQYNSKGKRTN